MIRATVVLVAACTFLSACGANGAAEGSAPAAGLGEATAQPIATQPASPQANLPTPVQEPTMDANQPTRENPAPNAPTEPANQPPKATQPAFQATPIAAEPAATPTPASPGAQGTATPLDPALARLVVGAQADLAKRRGVAIDAIEIADVRSVTWPDPSLGCPQPGMAYKQVPVDGVLIRLRVDGMIFNYHGGGGRAPFLCEQPAQDASPAPAPGDQ